MKKISTAHWLLFIVAAVQLLLSLGLSALVAFGPADLYIPMWLQLLLSPVSLLAPFVIYCIITKSNPLKLFAGIKLKFQEKWQPAVAWLAKIFCLGVSRRICDRVILSVKTGKKFDAPILEYAD